MKTRHDYWDQMLWQNRKHLFHFKLTADWVLERWSAGWSAIREIGSHDHGILPLILERLTPEMDHLEQVEAVDLTRLPDHPRIATHQVDYMEQDFPAADVTICQHVIQHVVDAEACFAKLKRETRAVLVLGGTYRAPATTPQNFPGYPPDHHIRCRHFEIDYEKVVGWADGWKPTRWAVKAESGLSRWMGLWELPL